MQLYKCVNCQHEWEGTYEHDCEWCGGESYILDTITPLGAFVGNIDEILRDIKRSEAKRDR